MVSPPAQCNSTVVLVKDLIIANCSKGPMARVQLQSEMSMVCDRSREVKATENLVRTLLFAQAILLVAGMILRDLQQLGQIQKAIARNIGGLRNGIPTTGHLGQVLGEVMDSFDNVLQVTGQSLTALRSSYIGWGVARKVLINPEAVNMRRPSRLPLVPKPMVDDAELGYKEAI